MKKPVIASAPRARPVKMLRFFRACFGKLKEAHVAKSNEFLTSYQLGGRREILLCGLQQYVPGERLNPRGPLDDQALVDLLHRASFLFSGQIKASLKELVQKATSSVQSFVARVNKMIKQAGHIPDLAGIGNLIMTAEGQLKLVDINNI